MAQQHPTSAMGLRVRRVFVGRVSDIPNPPLCLPFPLTSGQRSVRFEPEISDRVRGGVGWQAACGRACAVHCLFHTAVLLFDCIPRKPECCTLKNEVPVCGPGRLLVDVFFLFFFCEKKAISNRRRLHDHRRRFPSNRHWIPSNRCWLSSSCCPIVYLNIELTTPIGRSNFLQY